MESMNAGKNRFNQTPGIICRHEWATCTDFDTMLKANIGLIAKLAAGPGKEKCRQIIPPTR